MERISVHGSRHHHPIARRPAGPIPAGPTLAEALTQYVRDGQVRGLAVASLERIERVGRQLAEVVGDPPLSALTAAHLERYITSRRMAGNSPTTINVSLVWIKSWLAWCESRGWTLSPDVRRVRHLQVPQRLPRVADPDVVRRLLEGVGREQFDHHRFRVQVLLMLDTGARVGETCGMDVDDVAADLRTIRVLGKGARERMLYLSPAMSAELAEWLERRRRDVGHLDLPCLLPTLTGRRQISGNVGDQFRHHCRKLGLPHMTPHGLRHLWATQHCRAGTSPLLLRQLGGWSGMEMVMHYVHRVDGPEALQAARAASLVGRVSGVRVKRR